MKKEKMNNKGFSLVELIIVVAIMAVLVVALAPQYLKYVEKSRNSTDVNNATAVVTALQVWAADPDAGSSIGGVTTTAFAVGDTFTLTFTGSAGPTATGAVASALSQAAIDPADMRCKSKTSWDTYSIEGEVKSDGSIEFNYASSTGGTDNDAFENAMK